MIRRFGVVLVGAAACGLTIEAHAAGFALTEDSAVESGEADSGFAAAADDPSTITSNPAGMTYFSGLTISGTMSAVLPSGNFTLAGAQTNIGPLGIPESGGAGPDPTRDAYLPAGYLIYAPTDELRLGLGISVPFGLTTNWDSQSAPRYQALISKVQTIDINPSIAYKVTPWLSLGAGISAQWGKVELSNAVDFGTLVPLALSKVGLIPPAALPAVLAANSGRSFNDGLADVKGSSWEVGYDLGAIVEPTPGLRLGLSYRSAIDHSINGSGNFTVPPQFLAAVAALGEFSNTSAQASLDLPDQVIVGLSDDVTPQLTLNLTYKWTDWSRFSQIAVYFGNPLQPPAIQSENYQNTSFISVGGSYKLDDQATLRAGFAYDESPVQDIDRDFRLPDGDRYWLTIGGSYKVTDHLALSASYEHLFFSSSNISHSVAYVPGVVNTVTGGVTTSADIIAGEVTVNF